MFRHDITYEDFDGKKVTDTLYFNLTKSELIELNVTYENGLEKAFEKIQKEENPKETFLFLKKLLLASYGEKSDDGKRFIKSDELREAFTQTVAYDLIFIALAEDNDFGESFIKGVFPKELVQEFEKSGQAINVMLPPLPGDVPKE